MRNNDNKCNIILLVAQHKSICFCYLLVANIFLQNSELHWVILMYVWNIDDIAFSNQGFLASPMS